ncbi:MAG: thiamine phosphate synthase [Pyrinomonas sp.]|uniref:thiamine phosphate synthase n=1 Tax=Pyrinomonas sp. TaxID=2080306 RepID=UPI00331CD59B
MLLKLPIIYLVTSGELRDDAAPTETARTLDLVLRATQAGITAVQLREKNLSGRALYELARQAVGITRGTATRLLVNDRADIARAAEADGVHLTARSMRARVIRQLFGERFLIGVSTHSFDEAKRARDEGADFILFGPVFDTPQKRLYGPPLGLDLLREITTALDPFPVVAIGGITEENIARVFEAGASGAAAIKLFSTADDLCALVGRIIDMWRALPKSPQDKQ